MNSEDIYNMLADLRDANKARQKEWDKGKEIPDWFRVLELKGEVGELCNIVKKLCRNDLKIRVGIDYQLAKQQLADEIGDVIISLDLITTQLGLPLFISFELFLYNPNPVINPGVAAAKAFHLVATMVEIHGINLKIKMDRSTHSEIVTTLSVIAWLFDIDFIKAVKNKFNKTSEKHGFKTKM